MLIKEFLKHFTKTFMMKYNFCVNCCLSTFNLKKVPFRCRYARGYLPKFSEQFFNRQLWTTTIKLMLSYIENFRACKRTCQYQTGLYQVHLQNQCKIFPFNKVRKSV